METFVRTGRNTNIGFLIPENPNQCWVWKGYLDQNGYGQVRPPRGQSMPAHRFVWAWVNQASLPPRSSGLEIHHSCHNRSCVNPGHLSLITLADNRARKAPRTRRPIKHGSINGYNQRHCRCEPCRKAWSSYQRERYYTAKAEFALFQTLRLETHVDNPQKT
jgi:hypothetical protein